MEQQQALSLRQLQLEVLARRVSRLWGTADSTAHTPSMLQARSFFGRKIAKFKHLPAVEASDRWVTPNATGSASGVALVGKWSSMALRLLAQVQSQTVCTNSWQDEQMDMLWSADAFRVSVLCKQSRETSCDGLDPPRPAQVPN